MFLFTLVTIEKLKAVSAGAVHDLSLVPAILCHRAPFIPLGNLCKGLLMWTSTGYCAFRLQGGISKNSQCMYNFSRLWKCKPLLLKSAQSALRWMWAQEECQCQDHLVTPALLEALQSPGLCWGQVVLLWPSLKRTRRMFLANLQTWSCKRVSDTWKMKVAWV